KKLILRGTRFARPSHWSHAGSLDWHVPDDPPHNGLPAFGRDLNRTYTAEPALHEGAFEPAGFQWIDCNDSDNSVVSLMRKASNHDDFVVAILNFTPVPRHGYVVGVPPAPRYTEIVNSDASAYGGTNVGNGGVVIPDPAPSHGFEQSLRLTLPPLAFLLLKPAR